MLTKKRVAQIKQSRLHGNLYMPGSDIDALVDAVETLTEALDYYGFKIVADSMNTGKNQITTATGLKARQALAKVYGEEISDGKMMDMAAKAARGKNDRV